jgi:hypothetical protein
VSLSLRSLIAGLCSASLVLFPLPAKAFQLSFGAPKIISSQALQPWLSFGTHWGHRVALKQVVRSLRPTARVFRSFASRPLREKFRPLGWLGYLGGVIVALHDFHNPEVLGVFATLIGIGLIVSVSAIGVHQLFSDVQSKAPKYFSWLGTLVGRLLALSVSAVLTITLYRALQIFWQEPYTTPRLIGIWSLSFALSAASTLIAEVAANARSKENRKSVKSMLLRSLNLGAASSFGSSLVVNTLYFAFVGLLFNQQQFGLGWEHHRISFDLTFGSLITMPLGQLFRQMSGFNLNWRQALATCPSFWRNRTPENFIYWTLAYSVGLSIPWIREAAHWPLYATAAGFIWNMIIVFPDLSPSAHPSLVSPARRAA